MISGPNTQHSSPISPLPLFPARAVRQATPLRVCDLLEPETQARLGAAKHRRQMDVGVTFAVALLQEVAGLKIKTDGERRRSSYIGIIADMLDGFERALRVTPRWLTGTRN